MDELSLDDFAPSSKKASSSPIPKAGSFGISKGKKRGNGERVLLYGPGGVGKTTMASLITNARFIDLENSSLNVDTERLEPGEDGWSIPLLLSALVPGPHLEGCNALIIDSSSKLEDMIVQHVIDTIPVNDKGLMGSKIEDYGWGKGYVHVYDIFKQIIGMADNLSARGIHIIWICHENANRLNNAMGDNYLRIEPRLQNSEKSNVRAKLVESCDHAIYLSFDISVKDSKVQGSGSRRCFVSSNPAYISKSRTLRDNVPFKSDKDDAIWRRLGINQEAK